MPAVAPVTNAVLPVSVFVMGLASWACGVVVKLRTTTQVLDRIFHNASPAPGPLGSHGDGGLGRVAEERQRLLEVQLDGRGIVRQVADRHVGAQLQVEVTA